MKITARNEELNPLRCKAIERPEEALGVRRLHCRYYDDCLDISLQRRWPGFTCQGCSAFAQRSTEERIWDTHKLLDLAAVILGEERQEMLPWPGEEDGVVTREELAAEEARQQELEAA